MEYIGMYLIVERMGMPFIFIFLINVTPLCIRYLSRFFDCLVKDIDVVGEKMTRIGCKMANSYHCDIYMCSDYSTFVTYTAKRNLSKDMQRTLNMAFCMQQNSHFYFLATLCSQTASLNPSVSLTRNKGHLPKKINSTVISITFFANTS